MLGLAFLLTLQLWSALQHILVDLHPKGEYPWRQSITKMCCWFSNLSSYTLMHLSQVTQQQQQESLVEADQTLPEALPENVEITSRKIDLSWVPSSQPPTLLHTLALLYFWSSLITAVDADRTVQIITEAEHCDRSTKTSAKLFLQQTARDIDKLLTGHRRIAGMKGESCAEAIKSTLLKVKHPGLSCKPSLVASPSRFWWQTVLRQFMLTRGASLGILA